MAVNRSNKGGISRARQIANAGKTPVQQAQAIATPTIPPTPSYRPATGGATPVGPVRDIGGTRPGTEPTSPIKYGGPLGCGTPGADTWGMAKEKNALIRRNNPGEPPFIYYNDAVASSTTGELELTAIACPNPQYVKDLPVREVVDPETPIPVKTESIVATVIDKIIEDSKDIIKEIETKVDDKRPVVLPPSTDPDIIVPPTPITPTEVLLENQASCEKNTPTPEIKIVNEFNPSIDIAVTSSIPTSEVIVNIEAPTEGCMDPDAINYDPNALIDNGSCVYEPVAEDDPVDITEEEPPPPPLDIPAVSPFLNSHGEVVFEVLAELVEQTERTDEDGIITLDSGEKIVASLELLEQISRNGQEESDLIQTPVDDELAKKFETRDELGELASDSKLASEEDVVIIGDREKIQKELIRNKKGIIILKENDNAKLNISLRNRSFSFNQYKKNITTELNDLIGKI